MAPRDNALTSIRATPAASKVVTPAPDLSFGATAVGPLSRIPVILRRLGADPVRVLRSVGVDAHIFDDPGNRMSLQRVGPLLRACIEATGQPHFGLIVASEFELPMLNTLGYLVRHQPTVRAALRTLVLQLHLQDRGAVVALDESGARSAQLSYAVCTPHTPETGLIHSTAMMIGFRLLKAVCGPTWRPIEVQLAQGTPDDVAVYRGMFESPVRFDAPLSTITFERRWLDADIPGADPDLLRLLSQMAAALDGQTRMSLADRVRRVLRNSVLAGTANARHVGEIFSLSERGLRRHLAREGVSLNELIGEARFVVADQLLEQTGMPLGEIAVALHYADLSAFSRAFRGWTGVPPSAWRLSVQSANGEAGRNRLVVSEHTTTRGAARSKAF
ncbi:MAG TPA: AraC family transcriptional regulator [Burkholderiaceae bacterium]|nr:AraC family transcriptional regulator [Burkholderiaceae bacterium]